MPQSTHAHTSPFRLKDQHIRCCEIITDAAPKRPFLRAICVLLRAKRSIRVIQAHHQTGRIYLLLWVSPTDHKTPRSIQFTNGGCGNFSSRRQTLINGCGEQWQMQGQSKLESFKVCQIFWRGFSRALLNASCSFLLNTTASWLMGKPGAPNKTLLAEWRKSHADCAKTPERSRASLKSRVDLWIQFQVRALCDPNVRW